MQPWRSSVRMTEPRAQGRKGAVGPGPGWGPPRSRDPRPGCCRPVRAVGGGRSLGARERPPALLQQLFQVVSPLHRGLQRAVHPQSGPVVTPARPRADPASGTHLMLFPEAAHGLLLLRQGQLHPAGECVVGCGPTPWPDPAAGMRLSAAGGPGRASILEEPVGWLCCPPHPSAADHGHWVVRGRW